MAGADLPILRALHEGATVAAQELELRLPDRQPLAIYAGASPILDGRGEVVGCIGSFFDITERKRAELDALEQRNRLAHLWRVATLGELSGRIAHELSQPLTAILANVQAAQRMLSAPQPQLGAVREILEEIVEADLHAADVIQRTRALMRNEPVARRPIDLNRAVEHALELIHVELSARNVVARVVLSRRLPPVLGDDVQLQQVLLNLVINACDAMSDIPVTERRLTIVTRLVEEDAVQLYVRDRGAGIPDHLLDAVFRPFVSTKRNGLGLGLSICKSIVADHGGKLWAYNNSDSGATFALALPRVNTPGNGRVAEPVQRAATGRSAAGPVS